MKKAKAKVESMVQTHVEGQRIEKIWGCRLLPGSMYLPLPPEGVRVVQTSDVVLRKETQRSLIFAALELKQKLKGSVVWERVDCGKRGCRKRQNGTLHGPYPYLHYYSSGKVKRKYLSKALGDLVSRSVEELKELLKEAESEVLGQANRAFSSIIVKYCFTPFA
jgi:hypothetical protein